MQHSSLPPPLISDFHTRHAYSRPSLIEVIQPSRCQTRGVLPLSLSSGCDSGSALIPLPSIPSSARLDGYGNTAAESSSPGSALWINGTCCKHYTLEHPSQAAPSGLPITHCWAHGIRKIRGLKRSLLTHGNVLTCEKYVTISFAYINRPACIVPHDLEAPMQKERMSGFVQVSCCWRILWEISLCVTDK